ncbi:MAG: non-canonical purine NTP pyrophosphatase [Rhizobiaceae bacterium]
MRKLETREIILASHNSGKLVEIRELMEPFGFNISSVAERGLAEPEENGTTFEANAYTKAYAAASATNRVALSDDSGLCVEALDGDPGVYTADWAEKDDGSGRDFFMAMHKVEEALAEKGASDPVERRGYFCAVLCLCWPDGHAEYYRGEAHGQMVWPPRGSQGFGYDPVFKPDGHSRTFGEMSATEKHGWKMGQGDEPLSHRARAFALFAAAQLGDERLG